MKCDFVNLVCDVHFLWYIFLACITMWGVIWHYLISESAGQLFLTNYWGGQMQLIFFNAWRLGQDGRHFDRHHFEMHFLEWIYMNFDSYFTDICSNWSNWQYSSTGSDNGLVLGRQRAIFLTNDGLIHWWIYAFLTSMSWLSKIHHCLQYYDDDTTHIRHWNHNQKDIS